MAYFLSRRRPAHTRRNFAQRPRLELLEVRSLLSGAGSLDPTFGSAGIVTTPLGAGGSGAYAVTLQSNGGIVAAGYSDDKRGVSHFTTARYTTAGALDTTFGSGGSVVVSFFSSSDNASAFAEAIDSSGRIVLAGLARADLALTRLNANGTLDTTFGNKGKVLTVGLGLSRTNAMVIQPDGKIVVVATNGTAAGILARYNANGSLDTSFGNGGIVTTTVGFTQAAFSSVALQSDGKIVVGGGESTTPTYILAQFGLLVARFNSNGTLDTSFGSGGAVATPISGTVNSPVTGFTGLLIRNGQIVATGTVAQAWPAGPTEVALARYDVGVSGQPDGSLDTTFGTGGVVVTPPPSSMSDSATGAALQSDGSIVVGGFRATGSGNEFLLERYTAAGALDSTFNGTGIVTTLIGGGSAGFGVAIQPTDGKILLAGQAGGFALARYLGSATATTLALSPMTALQPAPADPPAAFVVTPITPTAADAAPGDMLGSWLPITFAAGKRSRA